MHNEDGTEPNPAARTTCVSVLGIDFVADLSGALYWEDARLLIVSDLHLEKGSSFAERGVLLPPYDTAATLARLSDVVARHDPQTVIALGDSFHDRTAHARLSQGDSDAIFALQSGRDWIWISGNHDPDLPRDIGGIVAEEVSIGRVIFRHEPTGALGEIAGHLHPKARVSRRGRSVERRCFAADGERAVMPAFGSYAGGLSIRDAAFDAIFRALDFTAHVLGDRRVMRSLQRVAVKSIAPEHDGCEPSSHQRHQRCRQSVEQTVAPRRIGYELFEADFHDLERVSVFAIKRRPRAA